MPNVILFGCKSTTIFLLEALKPHINIHFVVTISENLGSKNAVADFADVNQYCLDHNIESYSAQRYDLKNDDDFNAIANIKPDLGFVLGWQRLIPREILQLFSIGVFGMHGSSDDLPIGRGRSPMNWSLIEQRRHFFTNLFKYDPGIDSGDILDTFIFSIQPNDTAESMHYKNTLAMKRLILCNLDKLLQGNFSLVKQRSIEPTYYPKRSPDDSCIDWQNDIFQIEALIRAVTKPFNGAFTFIDNKKLCIWRASIFETDIVDYGYRHNTWGEVVEKFPHNKFLVKCRGGLLLVHEFECNIEIAAGKTLYSPEDMIKSFKLNKFGFHDIVL